MAQGVCVITEFREGAFRRVSFEIASEGRRLADELGEPLLALALGESIDALAADLGNYGVEKVYVVDDPNLKEARLGLLAEVKGLFMCVADFSRVVLEGEEREE